MNLKKEISILNIWVSYSSYNNKFDVSLKQFKQKLTNYYWIKFVDDVNQLYYCVKSDDIKGIKKLFNLTENIQIKFQTYDNTTWFPITKEDLKQLI
jgi:hypothetical protein